MKKDIRIYNFKNVHSIKKNDFTYENIEVEVMAIVGRYAMVRRKGCHPFVALMEDIEKIE